MPTTPSYIQVIPPTLEGFAAPVPVYVAITDTQGAAVTTYTTLNGSTPHAAPELISAPTFFYVAGDAGQTLTVKCTTALGQVVADTTFKQVGRETLNCDLPAAPDLDAALSSRYQTHIYIPGESLPDPVPAGTLRASPSTSLVPAKVTDLSGTVSDNQVALTWSVPADNGSAITDYIVSYKLTEDPTWTTFVDGVSTANAATVTGLTNDESYDFRVAAVNAFGAGIVSDTFTATPEDVASVPSIVTGLAAEEGNSQIVLTWSVPSDNGSAITDYIVQFRTSPAGTYETFSDGTSTTAGATVTGLVNDTAYDFRVAAVNSIGTGSYSTPVTATPAEPVDILQISGSKKTYATGAGLRDTSHTLTLQAPVVGNLLVAAIAMVDFDSPIVQPVITPPDGWSTAVAVGGGTAQRVGIYYKVAGVDESTSAEFTSDVVMACVMYAAEFSGCATTSPLDVTGSSAADGNNPQTATASGDTTRDRSLQIAARVAPSAGTPTWGNGFLAETFSAGLGAVAYKISTSVETPTTTFTGGSSALGRTVIAAFKGI